MPWVQELGFGDTTCGQSSPSGKSGSEWFNVGVFKEYRDNKAKQQSGNTCQKSGPRTSNLAITPHNEAAAAKSLQSCPTLCNPIDGSPPGSPVPGILQARTLEWVAISFSNAWEQKVKVKSLSRLRLLATPWTAAYQVPPSMGFSRQEYWSGVPSPSLHNDARSIQLFPSIYEQRIRQSRELGLQYITEQDPSGIDLPTPQSMSSVCFLFVGKLQSPRPPLSHQKLT